MSSLSQYPSHRDETNVDCGVWYRNSLCDQSILQFGAKLYFPECEYDPRKHTKHHENSHFVFVCVNSWIRRSTWNCCSNVTMRYTVLKNEIRIDLTSQRSLGLT
jgi:hypothetical protein